MLLAEKTVQGESNSMLFVIKFDVVSCFFFSAAGFGMGWVVRLSSVLFSKTRSSVYTQTLFHAPQPRAEYLGVPFFFFLFFSPSRFFNG